MLLAVLLFACGGKVVIDLGGAGGSAGTGGEGAASTGGAGGGPLGGQGGQLLTPCIDYTDCPDSFSTCQEGFCCDGKMQNGVCMCGQEPNCDLLSMCCYFSAAAGGPKCLADPFDCPVF